MISTILADDEVLARQKLRQLLRDEEDIEIVGECATASETIQLVSAANPELLFLDIRMPDMDGFDVLGALSVRRDCAMPEVVFTTAYDQYAVRAFEIQPSTTCSSRSPRSGSIPRFNKYGSGLRNIRRTATRNFQNRTTADTQRALSSSLAGRILFLPVGDIRWISAEDKLRPYLRWNRVAPASRNHGAPRKTSRSADVPACTPLLNRELAVLERGSQ